MFSNITKYCLWDLATEAVKYRDQETTQMEYEGEDRGQTQRYMVAAGLLVEEFFGGIEDMYSWGSPEDTTVTLTQLQYLQRLIGMNFLAADSGNEKLVREILAESFNAWRMKGTFNFLHWIIYKVFGWHLISYSTVWGTCFRLYPLEDILYDETLTGYEYKKLYNNLSYPSGLSFILTIDVFSDANFLTKKAVLERLLVEWTHSCVTAYINTP
jgi:hypothetical protein